MDEKFNSSLLKTAGEGLDKSARTVERLFDIARPQAVFGEPVSIEGQTVITASEVHVAMGFGHGLGGGGSEASEEDDGGAGAGSGGGGGGYTNGRPVAAVIIGSGGVRVEPIVDVTKIALAFFTAVGSMMMMLAKAKRNNK